MNEQQSGQDCVPPDGAATVEGSATGFLEAFSERAAEWLHVVLLEGRAAALSLSSMLSLAVAAGALAVSAWTFAALALAFVFIGEGWPIEYVFLGVAGLNALFAAVVWKLIGRLGSYLTFPVVRERLSRDGGERAAAAE